MIKRALLAATALAASTFVVVAAPAHADDYCDFEDAVKPTFVTSSISPNAVVIGKVKRTLTVTVRATDDCGVQDIFTTLSVKGNSSAGTILLLDFTRVAGTPQNGTWRATEVLSDYETGGIYTPSEIEIWDTNFNKTTKLYAPGTVAVRHASSLKLTKPAKSVKKNKKVTIKGKLELFGAFEDKQVVKVQARTSTKKAWGTVKTLRVDALGDYSTKIKVTKTKYYRVIHPQTTATAGATSKSYKVKKK